MKYLVLQPIGGTVENPGGWKPGAEIELDSIRAALHLAAGNVVHILPQPEITVSATDEAAAEVVETKRKKAAE